MAYKLADIKETYRAMVNGFESIPVGRRAVVTALAGAGLYALAREIVPRFFQSKPVTAIANATPPTPPPTNEQIAKGLVDRLNAYARAKGIPGEEPVIFEHFGQSGIHWLASYDRKEGNLQLLIGLPHPSTRMIYTKDLNTDGFVDKALGFSSGDAKLADGIPAAKEHIPLTPHERLKIMEYGAKSAINVADVPQDAQDKLQKDHRGDMEIIISQLERELARSVSRYP